MNDFDKLALSKLAVILLPLIEFMIVRETGRAILMILIGLVICSLSLKAKKAKEIEASENIGNSWITGCMFGVGVTFVGVCGVLNLIF